MSRSSARIGEVVVFDARESTPSDADLTFSWDFGNRKRGGTSQISQVFADSGTFDITLTVTDSNGRSSIAKQTLVIEDRPFPQGELTATVEVVNLDGDPLNDVAVFIHGPNLSTTTNAEGRATLERLPAEETLVLRLSLDGFAEQVVRTELAPNVKAPVISVTMQEIDTTVRLPNIENGGTAISRDGARVIFPPEAVIDADGQLVQGDIDVEFTLYDVNGHGIAAFPGGFEALRPDGERGILVSHGAMDVTLRRGAERLQIRPGKAATIEVPIYTEGYEPGVNLDLWSLDETTGLWIQEGFGEVVASEASPTRVVLRGQATHFTPWNADTWNNTPCKLQVQLKCENAEGQLVDLPAEAQGRVRAELEPCSGYGDECTPVPHQRHSGYHHGSSNPSGSRLEGQQCNSNWGPEWQCRASNGQIPADTHCKEDNFGRTGLHIGVCTRKQNDPCPAFMYCHPDSPSATTGQCQPPFYRHSNFNGQIVPLFQNWNGWSNQTNVGTDGSLTLPQVPRTQIKLTTLNLNVGGQDYASQDFTITSSPSGDPCSSDGLPDPSTLPDTCTSSPEVLNIGACPGETDPCDAPNPPEHCNPDPCEGPNPPEHCNSGPDCTNEPCDIRVECNPDPPGSNDIPNYCEIDALMIERTDGFSSRAINIRNVQVNDGNATPALLSTVDFNVCDPDAWQQHVAYFSSWMTVEFDEPVQAGDILRVYRQGVPAHQTNDQGQQCAASGTLTIYIGSHSQAVVEDQYNTFDIRLTDSHLP